MFFLSVFPPFWVLGILITHLKNLWALHAAENPLSFWVQRSSHHLGSVKLLYYSDFVDLWFSYECHWKVKSHFYCWAQEKLCPPDDSVCRNECKSIRRRREGEGGSVVEVVVVPHCSIQSQWRHFFAVQILGSRLRLHSVFLRKISCIKKGDWQFWYWEVCDTTRLHAGCHLRQKIIQSFMSKII